MPPILWVNSLVDGFAVSCSALAFSPVAQTRKGRSLIRPSAPKPLVIGEIDASFGMEPPCAA